MKNILFVCLGNICRSPSAEGVMKAILKREGLETAYLVDSAGTGGWHIGEQADRRMRKTASERGYDLTSLARQFDPREDFQKFDVIVGMDDENIHDLRAMDREGRYDHKIFKMTDFCQKCTATSVPDPYYGGLHGFEHVLDILEDACEGLLNWLQKSGK